jgi:hypothetical protein
MSDLQNQEIYELQAVMTGLLETGRQAASRSRDRDADAKIRTLAGRFLAAITGEQPDKIEIDGSGFTLQK